VGARAAAPLDQRRLNSALRPLLRWGCCRLPGRGGVAARAWLAIRLAASAFALTYPWWGWAADADAIRARSWASRIAVTMVSVYRRGPFTLLIRIHLPSTLIPGL
jgi:hypothetical protein